MAADPVTAVANVAGDAVVLTAQVEAQKNTTPEIDAAVAAEIQKFKDQLSAAILRAEADPNGVNLDEIRLLCA